MNKNDSKEAHTIAYYYVQSLNEKNEIVTICHTKQRDEFYYKFLFKDMASELAEEQKKLVPNVKFRVVKCIEIYKAGEWF